MYPIIISIWLDPINNLRFYLWQVGHYEYQFSSASQPFLIEKLYQDSFENVEADIVSMGYVKQ